MKKLLLFIFAGFLSLNSIGQVTAVADDFYYPWGFYPSFPVTLDISANDIGSMDYSTITISNQSSTDFTIVNNLDGTVSFNVSGLQEGSSYGFTYNICNDGSPSLECSSATVNVVFEYELSPCVAIEYAVDDIYNITCCNSVVLNLLENDVLACGILQAIESSPSNGTVNIIDAYSVEYIPNQGFIGTDFFTYSIGEFFGTWSIAEVTINVTQSCNTSSSITEISCSPYTAPDGEVYMETGTYTAVIQNAAGCDSTITIDFTALNPSLNLTESVCESFTNENNVVYSTSGMYTYYRLSADNCDTLIHLDLTVGNTSSNLVEVVTCQTYIAPDGQELSVSGIYDVVIPNAAGCDSLINIDLTITIPTASTISETTCDDYTAPDGMVYTVSGVYTAIIPNVAMCDSVITINLTRNIATSNTIARNSCGSYTAPDGQIYTQTGTYTAVIPNSNGCDSTITIDLTVNTTPNAVATLQGNTSIIATPAGLTYQWINCTSNLALTSATNQILEPVSGIYAVVVTNSIGCRDTSSCVTITNTASLNENDLDLVYIYPNPATEMISLILPENKVFKVEIFNVEGKMVKQLNLDKTSNSIQISTLEKGMYLMTIKGNNVDVTKRFIKQ